MYNVFTCVWPHICRNTCTCVHMCVSMYGDQSLMVSNFVDGLLLSSLRKSLLLSIQQFEPIWLM